MLYVVITLLVLVIAILGVCYWRLKSELKYIELQLNQLNEDIESNQYIRSSTGFQGSKSLIQALNAYINQVKKYHQFYRKKELMLNKEINNVSHDLRTPLTAIKGYTELLQETNNENDIKQYIQAIDGKVSHLIQSVNLFHELTYFNAFDYDLELEKIDIVDFTKTQLISYFHQFEEKQIQIEFDEAQVLNVYAHKEGMMRVMSNVIQNVLRYGMSLAHISFRKTNSEIVVCIKNGTQLNMNEEQLLKLFERSYTLDESRTDYQSGVGLYIVKSLVERQQGSVSVQFKKPIFEIEIALKSA
ncbi:sensor histidine kinase [Staphylococcus ratti]|uniref:histidine kinase n=1 Tax=Staphylococcus ratti TaxID=2892440 RepID=A0ABY3PCZ5_9STAP|nr:HAMP domain-containing sensor histidine kinase [Staphylococcus ratti]UEX90196.1 HAMP domain-containing histidine kinase [Staphylococcus ratti]